MTTERTFPILWQWNRTERAEAERLGCPRSIPWDTISPHEPQALSNHDRQSLTRLAQRSGLSPDEAVAVLEDRPWHRMPLDEAIARLRELTSR